MRGKILKDISKVMKSEDMLLEKTWICKQSKTLTIINISPTQFLANLMFINCKHAKNIRSEINRSNSEIPEHQIHPSVTLSK